MKFPLALVLLFSAVQLYAAVPALLPVTCTPDQVAASARMAMHHINNHHKHGYKFKLNEVQGNKMEMVDSSDCNIELQLDLGESDCHTVNPKHFEECELPMSNGGGVISSCTVLIYVRNGEAKVVKYDCNTRRAMSKAEVAVMCPDCPSPRALNDTESLKQIAAAVVKYNQDATNERYFALQEVASMSVGYSGMAGTGFYYRFALVETNCPRQSRINPQACNPLCPDRAQHAYCRTTVTSRFGQGPVECEVYPASNTTPLADGEAEPVCRAPDHMTPSDEHCHGAGSHVDAAIHPICSWPPIQPRMDQVPVQS